MFKIVSGIMIGLVVGTWIGADIVHREYYPILVQQAQDIETLLNAEVKYMAKAKETLELCQEEYIKQHKYGRDFVTNALGIGSITNHK